MRCVKKQYFVLSASSATIFYKTIYKIPVSRFKLEHDCTFMTGRIFKSKDDIIARIHCKVRFET